MAEVAKLRAMKSKQKLEEKMKTEKKTYCLCESTDDQRFMIQCDECQMWYHCDCMNITRTMAKKIEHYYCPPCISKDANLAIVYKQKIEPKKKEVISKERFKEREIVKPYTYESYSSSPGYDYDAKRCNHCAGCLRMSDCLKCDNCITHRNPCLRRICMRTPLVDSSESEPELSDKDDEAYVLPASAQVKQNTGDSKPTPGKRGRKKGWRKNQADTTPKPVKVPGKRGRPCKNATIPVQNSADVSPYFVPPPPTAPIVPPADPVEECWGPQCGEFRRPNSKYCSDECGIALAELRLRKYLPGLLDDYWRNPPRNHIEAEKRIKEIDDEGDRTKLRIKALTEYAELLDEWNRTVMQVPVDEDYEALNSGDDFVVPCQICSADVNVKGLVKHLERCFIRVEKQMSFGSASKYPQNPHNIFCEEYNKTNNTFCKRLRIGCPEHYKPSKDDEDAICGCPKIWWSVPSLTLSDLFVTREQLLAGGYCKNNRKHCEAHRRWDQYAAALIDVERARHLYRADELVEQRRLITIEQNHRGCVVELMTNFTSIVDSNDFSDLPAKNVKNDEKPKDPVFRVPYPVSQTSVFSQKSGGRGSSKRKGSPGIKTYTQGSEYNEDEVYFVGLLLAMEMNGTSMNGAPKKLLLFDVDGTLTRPRQKITPEMRAFMQEIRKKVPIAVVGGSDIAKIVEQLGDSLEDVLSQYDYVFSENGMVGYHGDKMYPVTNLGTYFGEEKLQKVVNFCLKYMSEIELPVKCGNFIERRNGMLNVSPIGRSCSQKQREEFNEYDKVHGIREKMVKTLEKEFAEYGMRFVIGGQISFDVFPVGWDKTYCLQYLVKEFSDIHFFGDKTSPGGNDYDIFIDKRVTGHTVTGPDDTKVQLTEQVMQ